MLRILILDDDHTRVQDIVSNMGSLAIVDHVLSPESFVKSINSMRYDLIMLDHDLGDSDVYDGKTWNGVAAAKYLAQNRMIVGDDQNVVIHSANPIGVANMMSHLKHADHLRVHVIHFAWAKISIVGDRIQFTL